MARNLQIAIMPQHWAAKYSNRPFFLKYCFRYMEISGKIIAMPPERSGSSTRGFWRKVFIVVEYEGGQHPKQIMLSNMNKAEDFAKLRVGQTGKFKFDGTVRENNGNYYLDLNCWSWDIDDSASAPPI